MADSNGLLVNSEIGRLKKVLLHRPGKEVENLTPDLMDRLLFDDIPYLKVAQEEHDVFAQTFRDCGVEVYYLEVLAAETLEDEEIRTKFIKQFIDETRVKSLGRKKALTKYFESFDSTKELVDKMIAGVRKEEIGPYIKDSLGDYVQDDYYFVTDPMPNLYFTRDPFATMGTGISLNKMRTVTRCRETIFADYIFRYHPVFKKMDIPRWYDRDYDSAIEGGDELIISPKVIAIGISQRTDAKSIDKLAKNILNANQSFETVLAFDIPKTRAFMHLDTVFTMVDYDKFTIHPEIEGPLTVYSIKKGEDGELVYKEETMELDKLLAKYLELDNVDLIRCGGKRGIDASREQWNDGSNTLAISPGEVIVYSRNHITNQLLRDKGVKLHVIPSSELSRGRGGPRCMSMPLERESLL